MKKITILTSVLALAACSGGSGGSGGVNAGMPGSLEHIDMPEDVVRAAFTSMSDTADNSTEINSYVENILGTDFDVTNSEYNDIISRKASTRTSSTIVHTTGQNMSVSQRNARNQNQINNMKAFFDKNDTDRKSFLEESAENKQLVHQYAKLACGGCDFDFANLDIDTLVSFLNDSRFNSDDVYNKYRYQQQHLSDQELYASGSRDWSDGYVKITETNNGKITNIKLYDGWYEREFDFKLSNKGLTAKSYAYALEIANGTELPFCLYVETDKDNLSINQIKQLFLDELDTGIDFDHRNLSAEDKALLIEKINALTSVDDARTVSQTEFEGERRNNDNDYFFFIPIKMTADLVAYGKEVGLLYSDFGQIRGEQILGTADKEKLGYVFGGGYEIKKIDKSQLAATEPMNFSGKAVGLVMLHTEDTEGTATNDYMNLISDATLNFADGTETVKMNFSDNPNAQNRWYDVVFTKQSEDNLTVKLSNGDKISPENDKYKFSGADIEKEFPKSTDYSSTWFVDTNLSIDYYGDNNNPREAVGNASILEQEWDQNSAEDRELFFTTTFGVVKKEN